MDGVGEVAGGTVAGEGLGAAEEAEDALEKLSALSVRDT